MERDLLPISSKLFERGIERGGRRCSAAREFFIEQTFEAVEPEELYGSGGGARDDVVSKVEQAVDVVAVLDDAAFGAATPVVPKYLAPADPASRWTSAHRGPAFYAYSTNYLIDLDHAVIMDVEASKRILKLDRLRLRGPNGARDEFHMAATAQNLRKMARLIPTPTQPLPA